MGPVSKAELKQAFAREQVGLGTPLWAAGMAEPLPLASIRELRWLVSYRRGDPLWPPMDPYGPSMTSHLLCCTFPAPLCNLCCYLCSHSCRSLRCCVCHHFCYCYFMVFFQ